MLAPSPGTVPDSPPPAIVTAELHDPDPVLDQLLARLDQIAAFLERRMRELDAVGTPTTRDGGAA
ncbi:MAG: hypothetical protein AB7I50_09120 [Vicinamibacterales bacterium]